VVRARRPSVRWVNIGTSLFLIAVGAILKYAVTAHVAGIDLQTAGLVLMIVGALGLALSLLLFFRGRSAGPPTGTGTPPGAPPTAPPA
jgi:hypothetical protein